MTDMEAVSLKKGEYIIYNNEKWKVKSIKQSQQGIKTKIYIKIFKGNNTICYLTPEKIEKYKGD